MLVGQLQYAMGAGSMQLGNTRVTLVWQKAYRYGEEAGHAQLPAFDAHTRMWRACDSAAAHAAPRRLGHVL